MGLINNLEKIDYLNENEIQKLDPLTFNGLEILEFIDLSWNHIKELRVDTFDGLTNLYVGRRRECVKIDKNAFNYSKIDFGL
jgi:hypothetical protein